MRETVFASKGVNKARGMGMIVVSKDMVVDGLRGQGVEVLLEDIFEKFDAAVDVFIRFPKLGTEG